MVLKEDNSIEAYTFSFYYFSSSISYSNSKGNDDEDDEYTYKRSITCNGICYQRSEHSDIILQPDTDTKSDDNNNIYNTLNSVYKSYNCIYNNIIKTATIDINFYEDGKCGNKILESKNNGSDICWIIMDDFSYRPLYYEESSKKLYYHSYHTDNYTSKYIDYFVINEQYMHCNSKCNLNFC